MLNLVGLNARQLCSTPFLVTPTPPPTTTTTDPAIAMSPATQPRQLPPAEAAQTSRTHQHARHWPSPLPLACKCERQAHPPPLPRLCACIWRNKESRGNMYFYACSHAFDV